MTIQTHVEQRMAPPPPVALRLELARLEARHLLLVALLALWLLAARMVGILRRWHSRARQRADLAQLDDHLLRDIGLDPLRGGPNSARGGSGIHERAIAPPTLRMRVDPL